MNYKLYKVAIIQNRLQRGGRLQVMSYMIKVLNDEGITPDILTLSSRISDDDIKSSYFSGLKSNDLIIVSTVSLS